MLVLVLAAVLLVVAIASRLLPFARGSLLAAVPLCLALLCRASPASAHFIDGYLAECSATGTGTCTEFATADYARQPVYFSSPTKGLVVLGTPYTFGPFTGTVAGRAVYDAPSGGNLLLVMPLAAPLVVTQPDIGDVGAIKLNFTALAPYQNGEAYSGAYAATTAVGTTGDGSTLFTGVALYLYRGILGPQSTFP